MLYQPLQLRNLELPNRWVMSPMCMYSCENGVVNDFHFTHYVSRAQGGIGLIIVEATGVQPEGRISHGCVGIWNDEQAKALSKIVTYIKENTATKMGIQLAHAGRKASTENGIQLSLAQNGWETVAPSPIPYHEEERIPHELTISEIKNLVKSFQSAAKRAVDAGFDVIEIHAAHGYLLHEFLSPLSNQRKDEYGGSLENRSRFLLEVVDAINEVLDENHPLFVRISATEYAENGWDINESILLAQQLKDRNVDLVDVSTGGNIHGAKIHLESGYQVPFAEKIKNEADIPTGAVGLITSGEQAEEILQSHKADLIFLGRLLLRNPYFPLQHAMDQKETIFMPHQYLRGKI